MQKSELAPRRVLAVIRNELQEDGRLLQSKPTAVPHEIEEALSTDPETVVDIAVKMARIIDLTCFRSNTSEFVADEAWRAEQTPRIQAGQRLLGKFVIQAEQLLLLPRLERPQALVLGRQFTAESLVSGALLRINYHTENDTTLHIDPLKAAKILQRYDNLPYATAAKVIRRNRTRIRKIPALLERRE